MHSIRAHPARRAPELSNDSSEVMQPWQQTCRPSQSLPGTCWNHSGKAPTSRCIAAGTSAAQRRYWPWCSRKNRLRRKRCRRLEHEFSLAPELDPAWAAQPLTLTRHEGRMVLVLKDPGGQPLDRILEHEQGQPLNLTRSLRIAIGLATVLGQVHRQGFIHKDIKPANVLVDDAGNVWLTGFGIASQLPHEHQVPAPPEIIAGTLAYMAPEQTGRMNRSIDARSDLYSLGVTLYEMLTGTLPFAAADPLEWIHCHIARQPDTTSRCPGAALRHRHEAPGQECRGTLPDRLRPRNRSSALSGGVGVARSHRPIPHGSARRARPFADPREAVRPATGDRCPARGL